MPLSLSSTAFEAGGAIPPQYTCDARNISPPLSFGGVPAAAKSLALIVEDPDAPDPAAPQRVWGHWVLYNLPADTTGLPQGIKLDEYPAGTLHGANDWKKPGYGGPCPPIGRHRYFFRLYALDCVLPDLHQPDKVQLAQALNGHVIEQAELVGLYQRQ